MNSKAIARLSLGAFLTLMVTACATGTGTGSAGNTSLQSQYERTIPVCVGEEDCRIKMQAAREWVAATTGYQLVVNTDERIETGGWGMRDFPAVKVERAAMGNNRNWILVELQCDGAATSDRFSASTCPPYWETSIDFNRAVSAAR